MASESQSEGTGKGLPRQRFQTLAWWSSAQLEQILIPLRAASDEWSRGWLRREEGRRAAVVGAMAHERTALSGSRWMPLGTRGGALAWIDVADAEAVATVSRALFATDASSEPTHAHPPTIAHAVAKKSWMELRSGLLGALLLDGVVEQERPEPGLFKPWSGAVVIELPRIAGTPVAILVNRACAEALVQRGAARTRSIQPIRGRQYEPVPVISALAPRKIGLRVELNECELELGSLQNLQIGDVVPLPHGLHVPLRLNLAHGATVCNAFLGRRGELKAIKLLRKSRGAEVALPGNDQH
jgi:hypothetical protein